MSTPRKLTTSSSKDHELTLVDSFNFSGNRNSFKIVCANPYPNMVAPNIEDQDNLEFTNSDTKKNIVKFDFEKDVSNTEPTKQNYHGVAPSWGRLQRFFEDVVKTKHPSIKSQSARHRQAASYINCWIIAGHSYAELMQMIRTSDSRVQRGLESYDSFRRRQWDLLNKKRRLFEKSISISFLIDKSVEFFQTEIKADEEATAEEKPDLYADIQKRLETMEDYIEMGLKIDTKATPEETEATLQILNKMVELYENHNGKLT